MKNINLIPDDFILKQHKLRIRNLYITCFIVFFIILFSIHFLFSTKVYTLQQQLYLIKMKFNKITNSNLQNEIDLINNNISSFVDKNKFFLHLIDNKFNYRNILISISNTVGDQIWLNSYLIDSQKRICEINGFSPNTNLVSEFMIELKKIPYLSDIKLTSMKKVLNEKNSNISFKIICDLI